MSLSTQEKEKRIELVRLFVGDIETSPFHPVLEDEEIEKVLEYVRWDVNDATKRAAITVSMIVSGMPTREITGDISVWNELSRNYLRALEILISNTNASIPDKLMPWAHITPSNLTGVNICGNKRKCVGV